jgi:catechol-2,3-dioxygenase
MPITGLNHAVLYVRDARRTADFYREVLDFHVVIEDEHGTYRFLRAPHSANHHDIAFFSIGADAAPSSAGRGAVGLYHLAWEVATLDELAEARRALEAAGALVGTSDHGVSKSLYAVDPDGLEFEVMWLVPQGLWGEDETKAIVRPLDLRSERRRYSTISAGPTKGVVLAPGRST